MRSPRSDAATEPTAASLRRFSRFYTRRLGLLSEDLLDTRHSLTEARVLHELAQHEGVAASDLARDFQLDAGYLSRVLRQLQAQDLVQRSADSGDGRRQVLSLTAAGRKRFAKLDRASSQQATSLVAHLDAGRRAELRAALLRIEQLLDRSGGIEPELTLLRPLQVGDIGLIASRQGQLYAQEYGWDETFEALVAEIAARFVQRYDPAWERCWVAEQGGRVIGSVFVMRKSARVAQLRLLFVDPSARGQGLGARLVDECLAFARSKGYREMMLWTNAGLDAARHLYEARGFVLKREEPHHSFGKDLVGQFWTLRL